jgi:hypothetical protein
MAIVLDLTCHRLKALTVLIGHFDTWFALKLAFTMVHWKCHALGTLQSMDEAISNAIPLTARVKVHPMASKNILSVRV